MAVQVGNPYIKKTSELVQENMNAAANFATTASTLLEQRLREQAALDVKRMQIQLQDDTNQFLLELEQGQHGGIDNWEKATQDFLTQHRASGDKNSAYYCRNQYTAQLYSDVYDSDMVEVKNRVALRVWNLHVGEEQSNMSRSLQQVQNSDMPNQLKIDQSADLIDNAQRAGIYTKPQADQLKEQAYATNLISAVESEYMSLAGKMKPSEIEKRLENKDFALTMNGAEYESMTDRKTLIKKGIESAQRQIKQRQDENFSSWQDFNTDLRDKIWRGDLDATTAYGQVLQRIRFYETRGEPDATSGQRRQLIEDLKGLLEPLKEGDANKARDKILSDYIKNAPEQLYAKVLNGANSDEGEGLKSLYHAKEIYMNTIHDLYESSDDPDGYSDNQLKYLQEFMAGFKSYVKKIRPELAASLDKFSKLPDDVLKSSSYKKIAGNDQEKARQIANEMGEYIWDNVASMDFSKVNDDYIKNLHNDYLAKFYMAAVEYEAQELTNSDSKFNKMVANASSDLVFTNLTGQEVTIGGDANARNLRNLENAEVARLSKILGVEPEEIDPQPYTPTQDGTDTNSIRKFRANGNLYQFEANENGKAELYESDDDGKSWHTISQRTQKQRISDERANADKEAREFLNKQFPKKQQLAQSLMQATAGSGMTFGVSETEWNTYGPPMRIKVINKWADEHPAETKELLKKTKARK